MHVFGVLKCPTTDTLSLSLLSLSQVLAADVSEANRDACAKTTKPLIDAVEALTTFASSPQFASTPAKISAQARVAQTPIITVRLGGG